MGKPLISDAAMRGMYETMLRMRAAKREPGITGHLSQTERATLQAEPEALLASLLSQVHRRDVLLTQGVHPLLETAMAGYFSQGGAPLVHTCDGTADECAAVAAGMALRASDRARAGAAHTTGDPSPRPVIIAMLNEFTALQCVLKMIEQKELSVLLVVGGELETRAEAQRRLLSTKVPVMPVDRADAVAGCRVTQEALLRSRNGWGGAVIHATAMPGSSDSLLQLSRHMQKRGLLPAA